MDQLSPILSALNDPTRRAILARLGEGELNVMALAALFPISQPAISRHLKLLEEAGLVARRIEGSARPCRLVPEALAPLRLWLDTLAPEPAPAPVKKKKSSKKKKKSAKP